jgi:hypothetical protein
MKCIQCGKDFPEVRGTAKYCSEACKKRYQRQNVPLSEDRGTNEPIKSYNPTEKVSENTPLDYYHSEEYLSLIKHLEETPLEALKKEGIFIPAWKLNGLDKKPNLKELSK